jgi:hypothetical protein
MKNRLPIVAGLVAAILAAAGCAFSPEVSGSLLDCSEKPCPEGWVCPEDGEKVCVKIQTPSDGGDRSDRTDPTDLRDSDQFDAGAKPDSGPKTCSDDCAGPGVTECMGEKAYHLCGEFDGDGCLEWGETVQCPSGCAGGVCSGCTVECTGRECGDDGCGGSCGECRTTPPPECADARTVRTWNPDGTCGNGACSYSYTDKECYFGCANGKCGDCTPSCAGKECGDDGCGESCGECVSPPANACAGSTLREYDRTGACGSGGKCSYAYTDRACPNGCTNAQCVNCTPNCGGRDCGPDGCGGDCGSCGAHESCVNGSCTCFSGYGDCNGGSDGCETDLRSDDSHCGGCGAGCNDHAYCGGSECHCEPDWGDCNGTFSDGCERRVGDYSNACATAADPGSVCGDDGSDLAGPVSGFESKWFKVRVRECSNWDSNLSVYATLQSPPGADYDLYLYRACGGQPKASSTLGPGATDSAHEYQSDDWGNDDDFDLFVEVRFKPGSGSDLCGSWTLNVYGNK